MYFRAFFGVPEVLADDGTPVNAVRGLLDFISRLVGQYRPTHLVCAWDNDWRPQWRVDLVPTLQEPPRRVRRQGRPTRTSRRCPTRSRSRCRSSWRCSTPFGICVVGADGYEADDVIGTLATQADMPVDVVTGDRDLFQLVDDKSGVRVLYIARGVGNHERVTDHVVVGKYPVLPSQYADFATMRGDASDGLPGVPGIGEKTASSLLLKFGDLRGIIAAAEDPELRHGARPAREDPRRRGLPRRSRRRSSRSPATSTSAVRRHPARPSRPTRSTSRSWPSTTTSAAPSRVSIDVLAGCIRQAGPAAARRCRSDRLREATRKT